MNESGTLVWLRYWTFWVRHGRSWNILDVPCPSAFPASTLVAIAATSSLTSSQDTNRWSVADPWHGMGRTSSRCVEAAFGEVELSFFCWSPFSFANFRSESVKLVGGLASSCDSTGWYTAREMKTTSELRGF